MKRKILSLVIVLFCGNLFAQDAPVTTVMRENNPDSLLNRFCLDVNLLGGIQMQSITMANLTSGYTNPLNASISNPKYASGSHVGFDIQGGYFFDHKRNWGIGAGMMYLSQSGTLTMDNYQIEFQSTDFKHDVFRQVISSMAPIKESITATNINIPLVLKYRRQLNSRWGVAADLGLLLNIRISNAYATNAAFNYEAIYQYNTDGKTVYDNSPVPDTLHDWLITQKEYNKTDPVRGAAYHFASLASQGYNVGLNQNAKSTGGTVVYKSGRLGFVFKPTVSYKLMPGCYLDLGINYLIQDPKNSASNYMMTSKVGAYNSMIAGESKTLQQTLGLNLGARFYFNGKKDRDGDGVADNRDKCPDVFGLKQFGGCPDTDGDGIPDRIDSCPKVFGLAQFNGCPDRDGDGIPDKDDRCPDMAGPAKFKGCPDSDGDGIPDIDDRCPKIAGLVQFNGCPDTDGDGIPDDEDNCPTVPGTKENHGCPEQKPRPAPVEATTVKKTDIPVPKKGKLQDIYSLVQFEVNSAQISGTSKEILLTVVKEMNGSDNASIMIDAYTDASGSEEKNLELSKKRAEAVKRFLTGHGIKGSRIKATGHGSKDPIAPNDTPEGREKNRRSILKIEYK